MWEHRHFNSNKENSDTDDEDETQSSMIFDVVLVEEGEGIGGVGAVGAVGGVGGVGGVGDEDSDTLFADGVPSDVGDEYEVSQQLDMLGMAIPQSSYTLRRVGVVQDENQAIQGFSTNEGLWLAKWCTDQSLSINAKNALFTKIHEDRLNSETIEYKDNNKLRAILKETDGAEWQKFHFQVEEGDELNVKSYDGIYTLYYTNSLEACRRLFARPDLVDSTVYQHEFRYDSEGSREFSEVHTGNWWWDMQKEINEKLNDTIGTIMPCFISSDATQLTSFSGDQKAWPVYLQIGNHLNAARAQYSNNCTEIIAYLPCLKGLPKDLNTDAARKIKRLLFQECYNRILRPLMDAAINGVSMTGPDSYEYRCHPLLAAFICDYPEACLATGTKYGNCPRGHRERSDLHDLTTPCIPKVTEDMVKRFGNSSILMKGVSTLDANYHPEYSNLNHAYSAIQYHPLSDEDEEEQPTEQFQPYQVAQSIHGAHTEMIDMNQVNSAESECDYTMDLDDEDNDEFHNEDSDYENDEVSIEPGIGSVGSHVTEVYFVVDI